MNEQLQLFYEDKTTGARKEVKKERFDLIPPDFLQALATHYGNGAAKYEDRNWEKGYPYSLSYAAGQRHLSAWWNGEDDDEEMGQSHLVAAAWHCIALWWFHEHGKGIDNRPRDNSKGVDSREAHSILPTPSNGVGSQSTANDPDSYGRVDYTGAFKDLADEIHVPRPCADYSMWFCQARIDGQYLVFAGKSPREATLAAEKAVREKDKLL